MDPSSRAPAKTGTLTALLIVASAGASCSRSTLHDELEPEAIDLQDGGCVSVRPQWGQRLGSCGTSVGVAFDAAGNLLVTGACHSTSGPPAVMHDELVAKISPQGQTLWTKGAGHWAEARVAVCANGDIALAGTVWDSVDLGGGPIVSSGSGLESVFVAKLSAAGSHVFSHSFVSPGETRRCVDMAVDSSCNMYLVGFTTVGQTPTGSNFLTKLDPHGQPVWDLQFPGYELAVRGVAVGPSDAVHIAGGRPPRMSQGRCHSCPA